MPNHKGAIYLKANCDGCKALRNGKCVLGFEVDREVPEPVSTPGFSFFRPIDPCPKPRTLKKLREIEQKKGKR